MYSMFDFGRRSMHRVQKSRAEKCDFLIYCSLEILQNFFRNFSELFGNFFDHKLKLEAVNRLKPVDFAM